MDGSVLTAILGCAGTIVGSAIGAIATAGKTNFSLEQLEKKGDQHYHVVVRMVAVE